jgi:hypothetical protein
MRSAPALWYFAHTPATHRAEGPGRAGSERLAVTRCETDLGAEIMTETGMDSGPDSISGQVICETTLTRGARAEPRSE